MGCCATEAPFALQFAQEVRPNSDMDPRCMRRSQVRRHAPYMGPASSASGLVGGGSLDRDGEEGKHSGACVCAYVP